jgi:hypothetical protein
MAGNEDFVKEKWGSVVHLHNVLKEVNCFVDNNLHRWSNFFAGPRMPATKYMIRFYKK